MNTTTIQRAYCKSVWYLRHHSPTILTCIGAAGVVATAIMSARATPKALQLLEQATDEKGEELSKVEAICIAGPAYIPAAVVCASTISCIFGANVLNQKNQASLASAYALLDRSYKEYRNKLIELHGEEADQEVRDALVRTHCNYHQIGCDVPDDKLVFYEEISGENIVAYEKEIMDAEYHINRNFTLRGYASLNEFYDFLGIPRTPYGDTVGWSTSDGYYWIDFEHHLINRDDGGSPIYAIVPIFSPSDDYLKDWE